jgi:hypothetical protein
MIRRVDLAGDRAGCDEAPCLFVFRKSMPYKVSSETSPSFGVLVVPRQLRLLHGLRRSLKEAAEIVSIFLTGGEDLGKKEHQLFGEDGLESIVDRVASIEKTLGKDARYL